MEKAEAIQKLLFFTIENITSGNIHVISSILFCISLIIFAKRVSACFSLQVSTITVSLN